MKHTSVFRTTSTFLTVAALMAAAPAARGGSTVAEQTVDGPVVTTTHEDWQFTLGLYGWFSGLSGDIGVGGTVGAVDMSFSDIIDNFDAGYMGMFEVRKGRWFGQIEGLYLKISDNMAVPPQPLFSGINAQVQASRLEAAFGYRVIEGSTRLDLLCGVEWWGMDIDMNLFGGAAGLVPQSDRENWFNPMIGFRLEHDFSDRWSASLRGEVGGFGVSSDISWQALAFVGYRFNANSKLVAGWRYTKTEYTKASNGFLFDAALSGPMMALELNW